jgi:hypothetical protein
MSKSFGFVSERTTDIRLVPELTMMKGLHRLLAGIFALLMLLDAGVTILVAHLRFVRPTRLGSVHFSPFFTHNAGWVVLVVGKLVLTVLVVRVCLWMAKWYPRYTVILLGICMLLAAGLVGIDLFSLFVLSVSH